MLVSGVILFLIVKVQLLVFSVKNMGQGLIIVFHMIVTTPPHLKQQDCDSDNTQVVASAPSITNQWAVVTFTIFACSLQ